MKGKTKWTRRLLEQLKILLPKGMQTKYRRSVRVFPNRSCNQIWSNCKISEVNWVWLRKIDQPQMVVIKLTKTMKLIVNQLNFQLQLCVMLQKQHLLLKVTNQLELWQSLSRTWQNIIRLSMINWSSLCIISIELMSIYDLYLNWKQVSFPKNKEVLITFL